MTWGLLPAHLNFDRTSTIFLFNISIANECVVGDIIMECNVDSLILNLLCNVSPCQIETGEADKRYSAAVCKTNEPYPLPRPVFCP